MSRRLATVLLAAVVLVTATCSRGSDLDADDAVELLVLDGLERSDAECLVLEIGDRLDLAEVAGISGDLDADELSVLFEASRSCRPTTVGDSSGVIGGAGGTLEELNDLGESEEVATLDVEGIVAELLRGGLEPDTAVCVAMALLSSPDPAVAVSDDARKVDAIVACEAG